MICKIKSFIKSKLKYAWGGFLFIFGCFYIYKNYGNLILDPSIVDIIIVCSTLLLAFFPLVSEVSILGFSLKKEIDNIRKEFNNSIFDLKSQMLDIKVMSTQTNQQNFIVGGEVLPALNKIKNMEEEITFKSATNYTSINNQLNIVSEDAVFLFKVRATIEKYVDDVFVKIGLQTKKTMIYKKVKFLHDEKWIYDDLYDYLQQVIKICNIGVHGEKINKEYIDFVDKSTQFIISELKKIDGLKKFDEYCICSRCKYKGNSKYSNVCPRCGFISDNE